MIHWDTYCLPHEYENREIKTILSNSNVTYKSSNGAVFPTSGLYRALTICVNIIYDQNPAANPAHSLHSYWPQAIEEGINIGIPPYLSSIYDTNPSDSYTGLVSRLYAESSFYQLNLLSDFMIVNIKQSTITPINKEFGYRELMNAVILFINQRGGLNTLHGYNQISDYDKTRNGDYGLPKGGPDKKIDIINFIVRNPTVSYGGLAIGSGLSYLVPSQPIKINEALYYYNIGTYQGVGDGNLLTSKKNVLTHEIAHFFLGGNEFHTSGGTTDNDSHHNTFLGVQKGYGLFEGGLSTCNGYERWRLGWKGPTNSVYDIAANNENSDILTKFSGERTFTLRDFVTYGDVVANA